MSDDWHVRFSIALEDTWKVVRQVCPYGWRDVDDIHGQVLLHVTQQDRRNPDYFKTRESVLSFVARDAQFALSHVFRRARRKPVEYRDPQQLPSPTTGPSEPRDFERDRLLRMLADCARTAQLLEGVSDRIRDTFQFDCEGQSVKEITQRLQQAGHAGTSASTIRRDVIRAHGILRRLLGGAQNPTTLRGEQ